MIVLDDYVIVDGTFYQRGTYPEVIAAMEAARYNRTKLTLFFDDGDVLSGYVNRSVGPVKVPLLLRTKRSLGGEVISTSRLVRVSGK